VCCTFERVQIILVVTRFFNNSTQLTLKPVCVAYAEYFQRPPSRNYKGFTLPWVQNWCALTCSTKIDNTALLHCIGQLRTCHIVTSLWGTFKYAVCKRVEPSKATKRNYRKIKALYLININLNNLILPHVDWLWLEEPRETVRRRASSGKSCWP